MTILTMHDARNAYPCWFERGAMRFFFRSRVGHTLYAGGYFVSSEEFIDSCGHSHGRKYSVRHVGDSGIDTVGEFQGYASSRAAIAAIRRLQRAS